MLLCACRLAELETGTVSVVFIICLLPVYFHFSMEMTLKPSGDKYKHNFLKFKTFVFSPHPRCLVQVRIDSQ